jgi:hypothetical protein
VSLPADESEFGSHLTTPDPLSSGGEPHRRRACQPIIVAIIVAKARGRSATPGECGVFRIVEAGPRYKRGFRLKISPAAETQVALPAWRSRPDLPFIEAADIQQAIAYAAFSMRQYHLRITRPYEIPAG